MSAGSQESGMQSEQPAMQPVAPSGVNPSSGAHSPERPGERKARWFAALIVLAIVAYPAARWMGVGGDPVASGSRRSLLQQSVEHYTAGRYDEAVQAAKAAIAENAKSAEAYNNLAVSYLGLRRYDEGIEAAQTAIRLQPDNQLAKNNLAWIEREKAKASRPPVSQAETAQAAT